MGLRPENKGWCRVFHLWNRWELWATGLGSNVGQPKCKDGNTVPGEDLACRTLWTPRGQVILPMWVCQVFLDLKMLRRNWRVGLGPPYLETRIAPGNKSIERPLLMPPKSVTSWLTTCLLLQSWLMGRNHCGFSTQHSCYNVRHPSIRRAPMSKGK